MNFTTRDIVKYWHKEKARICVLSDGCSSVGNFEAKGDAFINDMKREGVSVCTTDDVFQLYLGKNM